MTSSALEITADQLQRFVQLIRRRTGITVNEAQLPLLRRKLTDRLKTTRLSPIQYLTLLREAELDSLDQPERSQRAWEQLIPFITTGESFFFRDSGQLHLLRTQLLPELIQKQRDRLDKQTKPRLRLWSAGCSSGEEAYSLAIVITELLPDWQDWDIRIIGTDINSQAIAKAKSGCYTPWSFRQVDAAIIHRYFQPHHNTWKIHPRFQQLVHFRVGNLFADPLPNPAGQLIDLDLILCRNVFIYWEGTAVTQMVNQFNRTLRPGGYLITGHTELQGLSLTNWIIHRFKESIVYQQSSSQTPRLKDSRVTASLEPPIPSPETAIKANPRSVSLITCPDEPRHFAPNLLQTGENLLMPTGGVASTSPANEPVPITAADYCAQIAVLISTDQLTLAVDLAKIALLAYPEDLALLYQAAGIAQAQADLQIARTTLRKLLYLYPQEIQAYLALANVYAKLGDSRRSQKMLDVAHQLAH